MRLAGSTWKVPSGKVIQPPGGTPAGVEIITGMRQASTKLVDGDGVAGVAAGPLAGMDGLGLR
jgi:hypothetical protein